MQSRGPLVAVGMFALVAVVTPFACFYPDYTFDETTTGPGSSTGGAGPTTSSSNGAAGGNGPGASVGGGMSASSTGVGGKLGEICDNGIDDDDDEMIDCADGECVDMGCVAAVPPDWTGYFALYDGPPGQDPGCPSDYPGEAYVGNDELVAPPAQCTMCTCTQPTGQTCTTPATMLVRDGVCAAGTNCSGMLNLGPSNNTCFIDFYSPGDSTCGPNPGPMCTLGTQPCNVSVSAPAATVTGGMCNAGGGVATKPNATWMKLGHACGDPPMTAKGCNGTQVCLPKPPAKFLSNLCISHEGDEDCPPGVFGDKHVYFGGFDDSRGCTSCSCGNAAGGTCAATVNVYTDDLCTGAVIATFQTGSCANLNGNPDVRGRKVQVTQQPTGSACPTTGGQPNGDAVKDEPTTFCCIP